MGKGYLIYTNFSCPHEEQRKKMKAKHAIRLLSILPELPCTVQTTELEAIEQELEIAVNTPKYWATLKTLHTQAKVWSERDDWMMIKQWRETL